MVVDARAARAATPGASGATQGAWQAGPQVVVRRQGSRGENVKDVKGD